MKPTLLRNICASAIIAAVGLATVGCEVSLSGQGLESTDDDDDKEEKKRKKKEKKRKKKRDRDDEEANGKGDDDIDVTAILEGAEEASGVLDTVELKGLDTSRAPRLGRRTATTTAALEDAQWLVLPGNRLQIPNPKGWSKDKKNNLGILQSPDKKAVVLFTTYRTTNDVKLVLDKIGKQGNITKVVWKKPKTVRLGQDSLSAIVRGGAAVDAKGEKGNILFALIESGGPDKVLAVVLTEDNIPKLTKDQAVSIIIATRKRR